MKIDPQKANAAIDEYLAALQDHHRFPRQIRSNRWMKSCLERHGVIPSARELDFLDHCVLFLACIVICRRVKEVSEVEKKIDDRCKSLRVTIKRLRSGQGMLGRRFQTHLEDNGLQVV